MHCSLLQAQITSLLPWIVQIFRNLGRIYTIFLLKFVDFFGQYDRNSVKDSRQLPSYIYIHLGSLACIFAAGDLGVRLVSTSPPGSGINPFSLCCWHEILGWGWSLPRFAVGTWSFYFCWLFFVNVEYNLEISAECTTIVVLLRPFGVRWTRKCLSFLHFGTFGPSGGMILCPHSCIWYQSKGFAGPCMRSCKILTRIFWCTVCMSILVVHRFRNKMQ